MLALLMYTPIASVFGFLRVPRPDLPNKALHFLLTLCLVLASFTSLFLASHKVFAATPPVSSIDLKAIQEPQGIR